MSGIEQDGFITVHPVLQQASYVQANCRCPMCDPAVHDFNPPTMVTGPASSDLIKKGRYLECPECGFSMTATCSETLEVIANVLITYFDTERAKSHDHRKN